MTDSPSPHEISEQAAAAVKKAITAIGAASSLAELEAARVQFLGKKSEISGLLKSLGKVPAEARRDVGRSINDAKKLVESRLNEQKETLQSAGQSSSADPAFDPTLPGIRARLGRRHPLMTTMDEIKNLLIGLGFRYDDYPEVETEFFNFDALNTPDWHPARDLHDTFYTESDHVLRTHTSAFQVRAMKQFSPPPIRAMTSGRCYRCDAIDASHFPIFHQLDAIAVDRSISFADLKSTLYELAAGLFGKDVTLRFRPSYFPFTTPSAEVDVLFGSKWLEILGAGMMRPEVLRSGGLDPSQWQGFAFGLGVDRMTMIRHGIDDIRLLYENDERFLMQF